MISSPTPFPPPHHHHLPMAPSTLGHSRTKHAPATANTKSRPSTRMAMAKRGLSSLAIAISIPLSLTLATALLSSSASPTPRDGAAFWHPPAWAFHAASACSSAFAGLSSWLVWAGAGFRREPTALPLYLWQLAAVLAWGPLVLRAGAAKAGLAACAGALVALVGCSEVFGRVNPVAASLVKPCMAWVLILAFFTFRLL